jgi:hypothetical protein
VISLIIVVQSSFHSSFSVSRGANQEKSNEEQANRKQASKKRQKLQAIRVGKTPVFPMLIMQRWVFEMLFRCIFERKKMWISERAGSRKKWKDGNADGCLPACTLV